jgi:hypothetical protein
MNGAVPAQRKRSASDAPPVTLPQSTTCFVCSFLIKLSPFTKNLYVRSSFAGSIFFRKRLQLVQRMIEDKPVPPACQLFSFEGSAKYLSAREKRELYARLDNKKAISYSFCSSSLRKIWRFAP